MIFGDRYDAFWGEDRILFEFLDEIEWCFENKMPRLKGKRLFLWKAKRVLMERRGKRLLRRER